MLATLALLSLIWAARSDEPVRVAGASRDANGFLVHTVQSPYQDGPVKIRVLLPSKPEKGRRYRVLYVLPVEAGDGARYGDGLKEIEKLGLHDRHGLVCVQPTFARLPWYADHPTNDRIRQESHLLKVVLPFVEKTYPVQAKPEGRLVLGFSKSGWGAFSLLLRHPEVFGKAVAWDAPLDMDAPGKYGSGAIFGTRVNFQKYQLTRLLKERAGKLGKGKRLALFGYGNFRDAHKSVHVLMDRLKIAHEYKDGPRRKHDWHSGWVKEAAGFLVEPADPTR
jgi:S-formylglutathione hydrolase FrmB